MDLWGLCSAALLQFNSSGKLLILGVPWRKLQECKSPPGHRWWSTYCNATTTARCNQFRFPTLTWPPCMLSRCETRFQTGAVVKSLVAPCSSLRRERSHLLRVIWNTAVKKQNNRGEVTATTVIDAAIVAVLSQLKKRSLISSSCSRTLTERLCVVFAAIGKK